MQLTASKPAVYAWVSAVASVSCVACTVGSRQLILCLVMRLSASPVKRLTKKYLIIGGVLGSLFLVASLALAAFLWWFSAQPFLDDGPFHGSPAEAPPSEKAVQRLQLPGGRVLEVFDPPTPEQPPIVVVRTSHGEPLWSIYAHGQPNTQVRSIRFDSHQSSFPRRGTTAVGFVEWTYGRELTIWRLSPSGDLLQYWYSW